MSIWACIFGVGGVDADAPGVVREGAASHLYPTTMQLGQAKVDLAQIPAWCVPGHEDEVESDAVGPWLTLGTWPNTIRGEYILDEAAVRALRDEMSRWLAAPKVYPEVSS